MIAYHRDFIVSCRLRHQVLRSLLRDIREAEENARTWPHLAGTARTLEFHEDKLAEFMFRNCGFPKAGRYTPPTREEAQLSYIETVMAIDLGPRA